MYVVHSTEMDILKQEKLSWWIEIDCNFPDIWVSANPCRPSTERNSDRGQGNWKLTSFRHCN